MSAMMRSAFGPSPADAQAANRMIRRSLAAHALVVVSLFIVPRDWITTPRERPNVMTITLGGFAEQRTTGTTSIGGRTVEQVAPPEKPPEPVRPTPPQQPVSHTPVRTPPP